MKQSVPRLQQRASALVLALLALWMAAAGVRPGFTICSGGACCAAQTTAQDRADAQPTTAAAPDEEPHCACCCRASAASVPGDPAGRPTQFRAACQERCCVSVAATIELAPPPTASELAAAATLAPPPFAAPPPAPTGTKAPRPYPTGPPRIDPRTSQLVVTILRQ